jgi:alkylated DNA repair dioxygenase AlkB
MQLHQFQVRLLLFFLLPSNANSTRGLLLIPALLPLTTQCTLLDRLWHRDLSDPRHKTNLHLHYHLPYPSPPTASFFALPPESTFQPKDPAVHKPLSVEHALEKKLRWMTLGGQYDWTKKEYPERKKGDGVPFPLDMAILIQSLVIPPPVLSTKTETNVKTSFQRLPLKPQLQTYIPRPIPSRRTVMLASLPLPRLFRFPWVAMRYF